MAVAIPPGITFALARAMRRSASAFSIALMSEGVSQKAWIVMCGMRSVSTLAVARFAAVAGASGLAAGSGAESAGARAAGAMEVTSGIAASI
jgi:hypothetical protein